MYASNIYDLEKTRKKVRLLTIIQIILMIFVGIAYVILDGDSDLLEYEIPRNLVIIGGISFLILIPVLIINHNIKSKYISEQLMSTVGSSCNQGNINACSENDFEYKDTKFVIEKNNDGKWIVSSYVLHE